MDVGHNTSLGLLGVDDEQGAPEESTGLLVLDKSLRFGTRQDYWLFLSTAIPIVLGPKRCVERNERKVQAVQRRILSMMAPQTEASLVSPSKSI